MARFEGLAKALVAFALATACPFLAIALPIWASALMCGLATGLAVYWVPNRAHGFNVNDIAAALIGAGLDAIDNPKGDDDDTTQ